ncbi:MAG TPA: MerR family DNA-binding transcriptional regulator [Myxococcota bacterium]|nr:MerR family DNA-binding transcriptional regulator [Myxococcota bacterium]
MIPIGRFAQLTGLSVRALRHYESHGLLLPAHVDRESGYRYYAQAQLSDALHVRLLRALEMPLAEVAEVMRAPESAASQALVRAHRARVAARVAELEKLLLRLDEWLDGAPPELEARAHSLDEASAPSADGELHREDEVLARTFLELFGPADEI